MAIVIRDVRLDELNRVLELNNGAGPTIFELDMARLERLRSQSSYFRVAEIGDEIAGFLIALGPNAEYDSPNFRWFQARYDDFLYVDRVVVAEHHRGAGVGRVFYADIESFAEVSTPLLACEVAIDPPDDVSQVFHGTNGFQEVGQQHLAERGILVAMLLKDLPCFHYVRQRYRPSTLIPGELASLAAQARA